MDWPSDILALADHLGIEKFSVVGGSGGGPFALSCARFMPATRLRGTTVVCGIAPLEAVTSMGWAKWTLGVFARWFILPWILAPYRTRDAEEMKRVLEDQCVTAEEKAVIWEHDKEGNLDDAVVQFLEACRQGDGGCWLDGEILTRDWGFDLGEIEGREKVWLMHGDQDAIAPVKYAEWIDRRLGGGRLKVLRGVTHSTIWKKGEEEIFRQSAMA